MAQKCAWERFFLTSTTVAGFPLTVVMSDLEIYFRALFADYDWRPDEFFEVRLIGEKGTRQEGKRSSFTLQPAVTNMTEWCRRHTVGWAQNFLGAFAVPAILSGRTGTDQTVKAFTVFCLDIDDGDITAIVDHVRLHLGKPSLLVQSGGVTAGGQAKIHLYYCFDRPESGVRRVAELRKHAASKIGADESFGRIPQTIRLPGTAHRKNGGTNECKILEYSGEKTSLDDLAAKIESMPAFPGVEKKAGNNVTLNFAAAKDNRRAGMAAVLTSTVRTGGTVRTRWSEFSRVAGHYIYSARTGAISIAEAKELTAGWVTAHMHPSWPDSRVDQEFAGLLNKDIQRRGRIEEREPDEKSCHLIGKDNERKETPGNEAGVPYLHAYAAHRYFTGEPKPRRFLIDGLILAGKPHLLVGEAGAGKTYIAIDMALKIASGQGAWLGQKVVDPKGKHAVMFTAEDDFDEIHLRLREIDPDHRYVDAAGDRLIIMPLPSLGGAFTLVEYDHNRNPVPSQRWREIVNQLQELAQTADGLGVVIIDTFSATMHGEENAALAVNEWFRVASEICGRFGAAMIVTHHVRKASRTSVEKPSDMLDAVRGSSALPANVRAAIGIWHDPDYKDKMKALNLHPQPGQMYCMAVIKANNPEMMKGIRPLFRSPNSGLLVADGHTDYTLKQARAERIAWWVFAIERAARFGQPFKQSGQNFGVFELRHALPPKIRNVRKDHVKGIIGGLLEAGLIKRNKLGDLDVPDGPFTKTPPPPRGDAAFELKDYNQFEYDAHIGRIVRKPH